MAKVVPDPFFMDKTSRVSPKQAACPNCNALCCEIRVRVAEKISNMADTWPIHFQLRANICKKQLQINLPKTFISVNTMAVTSHKNKSDLMQAETCIMSSGMPECHISSSLFNNQCCVRFGRCIPYNGSTRYGSLQSRQ